jgi:hypothetical protein
MYHHNLKTNIAGILPNQLYNFVVEGVNSNWPVKAFPASGSISSLTNTATINTDIYFCEDLNCSNYIVYNSGTYQVGYDPFADIRLRITSDVLNAPIYTNVTKVICSGCAAIPTISPQLSWFELKGTNESTINVDISGLKPYTTYSYRFLDIGSNYPIDLQLVSGTFTTSNNKSYSLRTDFAFCGYEDCDNVVIGSGYSNKIGQEQCDKYYTNLQMSLDSSYFIEPIIGPKITVECDNCLPKPVITLPDSIDLDSVTLNNFNLITNITGLKPNSRYDYSFQHMGGNHSVILDNVSGYFNTDSAGTDIDLITPMIMCESSGLCGSTNVLGTIQNGDCDKNKNVKLRLKLDSDCLDYSIYSSIITVNCDNCLPIPNLVVPTSKISLLGVGDEPNIYNSSININNLKPYSTYSFEIVDFKSNHLIGFEQLSGSFTTNNETTHTLNNSIIFCESSGYCNNYQTTGTINSDRFANILNTSFRVKLNSTCLPAPVYSDPVLIDCEYCLPYIDIDIPSEVTLTQASGNIYSLNIPISPLKPYSDYEYSIKNITTNHMIGFESLSGSFNTENSEAFNLTNKVVFCESSGYCNSYVKTGSMNSDSCNNKLNASFKIELNNDNLYSPVLSRLIKINCDNCIPQINIQTPSKATLTSTNIYPMNIVLTNLKPYSEYSYSFENIKSNHLVGLKELSGVIKTKTNTTANISNSLVFCESSGYCNTYYTSGSINSNACNNLLSTSLQVKINSSCLSSPVVSDIVEVDCNNCIPILGASLPSTTVNLTSTNLVSITGTVSGLRPLQSYDYYFTGDNNWPILLDNISGSFVAKTSTENIVSKVLFCYPSGNCSNENGLLPYSLSSAAQKILNNNVLFGKLKLNVKSSSCNSTVYSSNVSTINCKDCLPCVRYADVQISGSPVIALDNSCCIGQKLLSVNVTNAVPSERYIYSFSSTSGVGVNLLQFNPQTGEMYFGSGGAGTINSICAIDLIDYTQTLINFELTHTNTNFKVYDSIGLVCNTGSC